MYDPDPSLPKPFTPSSHDLNDMIARAMARADADVEQARLRDQHRAEAAEERRFVRSVMAECEGRRLREWQTGVIESWTAGNIRKIVR